MDRNTFIIATAVLLFTAFVLGWFAGWLIHRLTRATKSDMSELDRLAQSLHDTEEARDQAIMELEEREAELNSRIVQTEAELRAAMEGLRDSRAEVEELREYIERRLNKTRA